MDAAIYEIEWMDHTTLSPVSDEGVRRTSVGYMVLEGWAQTILCAERIAGDPVMSSVRVIPTNDVVRVTRNPIH